MALFVGGRCREEDSPITIERRSLSGSQGEMKKGEISKCDSLQVACNVSRGGGQFSFLFG
jgi:hypothetical protein